MLNTFLSNVTIEYLFPYKINIFGKENFHIHNIKLHSNPQKKQIFEPIKNFFILLKRKRLYSIYIIILFALYCSTPLKMKMSLLLRH